MDTTAPQSLMDTTAPQSAMDATAPQSLMDTTAPHNVPGVPVNIFLHSTRWQHMTSLYSWHFYAPATLVDGGIKRYPCPSASASLSAALMLLATVQKPLKIIA